MEAMRDTMMAKANELRKSIRNNISEVMFGADFEKSVANGEWAEVYNDDDLDAFFSALTKADADDLEKAKKDISKLVPKTIVDSIGRRKTVYVRPSTPNQANGKESASGGSDHDKAWARHVHNTKVQRMGKQKSLEHIERHYGKEMADHIRSKMGEEPSKSTTGGTPKAPEPEVKPKMNTSNGFLKYSTKDMAVSAGRRLSKPENNSLVSMDGKFFITSNNNASKLANGDDKISVLGKFLPDGSFREREAEAIPAPTKEVKPVKTLVSEYSGGTIPQETLAQVRREYSKTPPMDKFLSNNGDEIKLFAKHGHNYVISRGNSGKTLMSDSDLKNIGMKSADYKDAQAFFTKNRMMLTKEKAYKKYMSNNPEASKTDVQNAMRIVYGGNPNTIYR